ncbi:MAG: exosortase-associated EpsI family protein [Parachlamydiales bacterium]|jgi:hypothetical protein
MKSSGKTLLYITLALAICIALLWQFMPLQSAAARISKLPLYGPAYLGENVPLSAFEAKIFGGVDLLKRVYTVADVPYFITVIDGTRNRHVVHDPYYCFHGGGWDVIKDEPFPIANGDARLVSLKKGDQTQEALYWFSDGKHSFGSTYRYWWEATKRRLTFGHSGEEPVLIVVQPIEKKYLPWNKLQELFPSLFQL